MLGTRLSLHNLYLRRDVPGISVLCWRFGTLRHNFLDLKNSWSCTWLICKERGEIQQFYNMIANTCKYSCYTKNAILCIVSGHIFFFQRCAIFVSAKSVYRILQANGFYYTGGLVWVLDTSGATSLMLCLSPAL